VGGRGRSLDLFPTIGYLAGYANKPGVEYDGVNIAAALLSDTPSPRTTFFFHSTYAQDCIDHVPTDPEDAEDEVATAVLEARASVATACNCSFENTDFGCPKSAGKPHGCLLGNGSNVCCKATATMLDDGAPCPCVTGVPSAAACGEICSKTENCTASAWLSMDAHRTCYLVRVPCMPPSQRLQQAR
jgi:hypothetical protein